VPADHAYAPLIPQRLIDRSQAGEGVALTRVQAESIGAFRLIQLVGLEIEKLTGEYAKILDEIDGYERILADERLVLDIIREDCEEMKEKFGTPRKTDFV